MALKDMLEMRGVEYNDKKIGVSEERIEKILPILRLYIAYWREYPDMFVEYMAELSGVEFHFHYYQRIILRTQSRYKYTYYVFPRGCGKSFMSVMSLMIKAILYPGCHLFVASDGKAQSAEIVKEKVNDICKLIPAFRNEINWERGGGTTETKDYCLYKFKNGSSFDILASKESTRGRRRHSKHQKILRLRRAQVCESIYYINKK